MTELESLLKPRNLLDMKKAIKDLPDSYLEKYIIFRFTWGDIEGFNDWKRKEGPKQYSKRMQKEQTIQDCGTTDMDTM